MAHAHEHHHDDADPHAPIEQRRLVLGSVDGSGGLPAEIVDGCHGIFAPEFV